MFNVEEARKICSLWYNLSPLDVDCAIKSLDQALDEIERLKAVSKRAFDYFVKMEFCPYGSPGHLRPCAGTPMHKRQCKACIAEFCGYAGGGEMMKAMRLVLEEVAKERQRQDAKWGEQNHHPVEWLSILGEEFGEACKAACEAHFVGYESTGKWDEYRTELIQTAAVAVAMVECLDRNRETAGD